MIIQSLIILVLSTFLIIYLFKSKGATVSKIDSINDIEYRFKTFHLKLLFGFFLLLPTNLIALTYLLSKLSKITFSDVSVPVFTIAPNVGTWLVVSIFLSLATSTAIVFEIVKRTQKENAGKYWFFYNSLYGFNAFGLLKYLAIIVVAGSTFLIISQQQTYTKFYQDSITINKLLEIEERTYRYSEIVGITHYLKTIAPNGKIVDKPHYGILFSDGFVWRTNDDLRTPHIDDPKIFDWLLKQTGLRLKEIEIDEK